MIEVKNLGKHFDKKWVLQDLSLTIKDGAIFGLVGINGAGKSTFLRLLSGVYKADCGSIAFDGKGVFDSTDVKKEIFFLPDDPFYSTNTKGNDLLDLYKTMYTVDDVTFQKYMNLFNLNANAPINNFSKGMRRQLFIALALSVKPKYLFLDEAFDGLDPLARLTFKRAIIELCEETNCTVIISSHSLRELEDICDSFGLLDHGHIASSGGISEEIEKVHKYQLAFDEDKDRNDFGGLDIIHFSKLGRVIKIVAKGDAKEIEEKIARLNPLFIDKVAIDFEELFIYEVESRGYLK